VVGTVAEVTKRPLGNYAYPYVQLDVRVSQLWGGFPAYYGYYPYYGPYPWFGYPPGGVWYQPWYRPGWPYPRPHRPW
jgi:starvation-inducible outer membrane lipoprotein